MPARPGYTTLFPYVIVKDADRYIEFLVAALGGVELGRTVHEGKIANARLRFGDTTIMVGEGSAQFPPSAINLYVFVDDADAAMARALAEGGVPVSEVSDKPYGDRQGGIADPAGNVWWLSTPLTGGAYDEDL